MEIIGVEPTVLVAREGNTRAQLVDVTLRHDGPPLEAVVRVQGNGADVTHALGTIHAGEQRHRCAVPEFSAPGEVRVAVEAGGVVQAERRVALVPPRRWDVHLVHISHHDWGYTDLPSNLWLEQDRIVETALRYCRETDGWPEEARFRYTVEQGWSVLHFLESHPERVDEVVRRVKEGRIEITALYANETTELCGHEELIRLLYPTFALRRRYGIPIRTAMHNDIPGMAWGLAAVLAGAGVEFFAPGLPTYFSWGGREDVHDFWDECAIFPRGEPGFFRWEAPDGARLLVWYSKMWQAVLDSPQGFERIAAYLARLEQQEYPLTTVRIGVNGGRRDNAHPSLRYAVLVREWNRRYASPRLIMSSNAAFLDSALSQLGEETPVFRGDLPNTDYTVGATCTALETGITRMAHDHLLAAETFALLAAQVTGCAYPRDHLERAYRASLLFDDHTWGLHSIFGPAQSGNQAEKKVEAYRAAALAHDVVAKSLNRIGDAVALPDDGYYLVAFNSLSWERTAAVQHQVLQDHPSGRPMNWVWPDPTDGGPAGPAGPTGPATMQSGGAIGRELVSLPRELLDQGCTVVDAATGEVVPHQLVALESADEARVDAARRYAYGYVNPAARTELRFVARDVPALGYRTYRVVPGTPAHAAGQGVSVEEHALENRFYRVELDPRRGTIARIYDKELGRELVDGTAPHGFNEFVARHPEDGREERPAQSAIRKGTRGPVCGSLVVQGSGAGCPLRVQEITLYADLKRIEIANRLLRDATPLWEIYFAFPFAVEQPRFRYEGVHSVIEPLVDQLPGSNSDAYAVQHWATIANAEVGVTWSSREAPIVCFGDLPPGYVSQAHHGVQPPGFGHPFLRPGGPRRGHLYSYVMNNNFRTNFQAVQVADVLFRYALTSHAGAARESESRDFGWGASNPLETVCLQGPQAGALGARQQLCRVEGEGKGMGEGEGANALLLTIKEAENGQGIVVRLLETAGRPGLVHVHLPHYAIAYAVETNVVEEDQGMLDSGRHWVAVPLRPRGVTTVRCLPATPILPG